MPASSGSKEMTRGRAEHVLQVPLGFPQLCSLFSARLVWAARGLIAAALISWGGERGPGHL